MQAQGHHETDSFFDLTRNGLKFRLFLLQNLPAALYSGVRVKEANEKRAVVSVPYKWFTRNPFRSTYFACLSMAAEMSTGLLAMAHLYKRQPKVSMLVTAVEGKFYKKAIAETRFICEEGLAIRDVIETSITSGESQTICVLSSGFNEQNELIAEFWITWSFKARV